MASNAVNFLIGNVLGEFKDSPRSVMTLDSTGDLVLLASKHVLNIVNISSPYVGDSSNLPYNSCKYPNKNVKWEVKAAQWNPHKTESSVFVITKNHVADIFVHVNGKVKLLSTLQSHTRAITDLDWSVHDSNLLLTCSSDGNAFLWDKRQLGPVQLFETLQSCSSSQVKWNKLEEHIFATSHDRDIRIWDGRKTDRPIYISGHLKKIHGLDWSTHNSKLLASASEDETVKFWDYSKPAQYNNIGELKSRTNSPIWKARFTPFENSLLTIDVSTLKGKGDNSLMLWDIENLSSPEAKLTFVGYSDVVTEFQWRKSIIQGEYQLVTWSRDNTLRLCRYESSAKSKVIELMDNQKDKKLNGNSKDHRQVDKSVRLNTTGTGRRPSHTRLKESGDEDKVDEASSPDEVVIPSKSPNRSKRDSSLTSPNGIGNTLQNELRSLSTIRNVKVRIELNERKCYVCITNKGDHRIVVVMSFPEDYPDGVAPNFRFDVGSTIEKSLQTKIIAELEEAARPLIVNNKACVEKCIHALCNFIEDLERKNILETDSARHQAVAYNKNIPYPRTCGATFCTDRLVTFQRPVHSAVQYTPRSLNEKPSTHTTYSSKTRSNFYGPSISRSPKDSVFSTYYKRHRAKKKEKSGPICVYNVASLLPVNKHLAAQYKITPSEASCSHNAEVAEKQGRRDLHQIWKILGEFMDKRLEANCEDIESGAPWATLPFGRPMIESIIQHYATIGDFQTLAMIVCMFPVPLPSPVVEKPQHHLQIPQLQRSSSTMKMGTSPSNSILSRSPPERPFLTIDTDVPNGWNSSRRRADSHNEYIERSSIQQADSEQAELQKHLSAISILNPKHHFLYNFYKTTYADLLYRWRMLNEREILMKTMTPDDDYTSNAIAIRCNTCHAETNKSWCHTCSPNNKPALQCALCRSSVRGPATLCINCRHGGHLQHFRSWFETENECPTGCGCPCLEFNAVE